jgi:hypothetical protein
MAGWLGCVGGWLRLRAELENPRPKPKRRRRGKRGGRKRARETREAEESSLSAESVGAVSAAGRSLDPADDYPPVTSERPYRLTFSDGSERDVPNDGRVFGPN